MAGKAWTTEELDALRHSTSYFDWVALTGSDRPYDAWEVKRRRVEQTDLAALKDDEDALESSQDETTDAKKRFSKAVKATEKPNLGEKRTFPDVITFEPAFVDLETTNLKANFGRILCGSVADMFGNVQTFRIDEAPFKRARRRDDVALAVALRDYLEQFDFMVTWYGKMFDVKYLNTRLAIGNERPLRSDIIHLDNIFTSRWALALHSSRLDAVAKTFRLPVQKTGLDPEIWNDAADGDKEAMDYVVEHCEKDVLVLRQVFYILKPFVKNLHR